MTLDMMNMENQAGGRRRRRKLSKRRKSKRGGSFLAEASVPAGIFLLHKYF